MGLNGGTRTELGTIPSQGVDLLEFLREHQQHNSHLGLDIAQRVHQRKPVWQQYIDGTLEVHLHALWHGSAVCAEFAPDAVFRQLKNCTDAEVYVHGEDFAVLRGIVKIAELARPVRSLKRLKLANDCHVFIRESFEKSRAPSREALRRILYEELSSGLRRSSILGRKHVNEVIKSDSEIVDNLSDKDTSIERVWFEDGAARDPIPRVRIYVGKHAVSRQLLDAADDAFEIRQVFACPRVSSECTVSFRRYATSGAQPRSRTPFPPSEETA